MATRGRPRQDGERYPSGKLKPKPRPVVDFEKAPMSGTAWQQMISRSNDLLNDPSLASEINRLGAAGKLSPAQVATAARIARIYGRYEYYQGIKRTTASPYYVREFISSSPNPEDHLGKSPGQQESVLGDERTEDDIEEMAKKATEEFKDLQNVLLRSHRFDIEALCVENCHLDYAGYLTAREALEVVREFFQTKDEGGKKMSRAERRKLLQKRKKAKAAKDEVIVADTPERPNPLKQAFMSTQKVLSPHLDQQQLEHAWETLCAVKHLNDFRHEKSQRQSA
jgi:hypothetical protein